MEKVIPWAKEFPAAWQIINASFPAITLLTGFIIGWYVYQMFFADWLQSGAEIPLEVEDVSFPEFPWDTRKLQFIIGLQHDPHTMALVRKPKYLLLEEKAIFQNILVSGTIGTGKTASVMYPLLKQALFHQADYPEAKAGMLVLDVKGNFYAKVMEYAEECGRQNDVILIKLDGEYRYNPLHKPGMEAVDLAERSRTVMDLFNSGARKDAFWDTKAAQMMTECIRLLRSCLNYCTLGDVHRLVTDRNFLNGMMKLLDLQYTLGTLRKILEEANLDYIREWIKQAGKRDNGSPEQLLKTALELFLKDVLEIVNEIELITGRNVLQDCHPDDAAFWDGDNISRLGVEALIDYADSLIPISDFDYHTCKNYFSGEFNSKAENTIETIKAVVTQMTAFFASSERIARSFCPAKEEKNVFTGFEEVINNGKIVVLAMNVAEYPQVSRTIAAYLKLDFQAEIQQRTSPGRKLNNTRPMFFICDEYQEFVTGNDGNFYGVSREARCCSIVASQSYTSLLKSLNGDRPSFETLLQNLISKIALRSDDKLTIETMQLLTGKVEKTRLSKNVSESASDSQKSGLFGGLVSTKASLSESINVSTQREALFDERDFTQSLKQFKAICFLAAEDGMQEPMMVHLLPYFAEPILSIGKENHS